MSTLAAPSSHAAPSRRALALLAVGVLIVHALLLTSMPVRFGPERPPSSEATAAFVTRSIPPPRPAEPAPAALPEAAPEPKPARKKPTPELSEAAAVPARKPRPADYVPDAPSPADLLAQAAEMAARAEAPATSAPEAAPPASPAEAPAPAAATAQPETTKIGVVRLPGSVRLEYKAIGAKDGRNYYGNSELNWQNKGSEYAAVLEVRASFPASLFLKPRILTSEGELTEIGLAPKRFSDKSRSERAAHFDRDKGKVTFSANTADAPWIAGAQDRMSFFLQLAGMLAGNPAEFVPGNSITLYTVGPTQADTWTFLVEAEETLTVSAGNMPTLKLSRKPRGDFDQKVEVWFAPSLDYLPVKSKITEQNGDFVEQSLESVLRP
ncbi:DUF3108 domain-containing protein [Polaromonas sp. LjRoot131]|uniref:DUF3108 domain-containing protein n=1 Tax=Polaromonas sp. LjRoot131 TaxID=3342262 RepID=UPI003ED104E5